jgi:hypothetical protein
MRSESPREQSDGQRREVIPTPHPNTLTLTLTLTRTTNLSRHQEEEVLEEEEEEEAEEVLEEGEEVREEEEEEEGGEEDFPRKKLGSRKECWCYVESCPKGKEIHFSRPANLSKHWRPHPPSCSPPPCPLSPLMLTL